MKFLKEETIWTHSLLFRFLSDLNFEGVHGSQPTWVDDRDSSLTLAVLRPLPKEGTEHPLARGNDALLRRLQHWWLTSSSEQGRSTQELSKVKFRENMLLAGSLSRACLERLEKKKFQSFPETYWYKDLCAIKSPSIFKFYYAEILAFNTKSVFFHPLFFPAIHERFLWSCISAEGSGCPLPRLELSWVKGLHPPAQQ